MASPAQQLLGLAKTPTRALEGSTLQTVRVGAGAVGPSLPGVARPCHLGGMSPVEWSRLSRWLPARETPLWDFHPVPCPPPPQVRPIQGSLSKRTPLIQGSFPVSPPSWAQHLGWGRTTAPTCPDIPCWGALDPPQGLCGRVGWSRARPLSPLSASSLGEFLPGFRPGQQEGGTCRGL